MNTTREMKSGKCVACRIVWRWDGAPLLRDARCPVHRTKPLARTTHLLRGFRSQTIKDTRVLVGQHRAVAAERP